MNRTLGKYIIAAGIALALTFAQLAARGIFSVSGAKTICALMCDSFFVTGVLFMCVGLLVFAANAGTFDMIAFGVVKLGDLIRNNTKNPKYKSYYDFKQEKHEKNTGFAFLLIVGAVFTAAGLLFMIPVYF